MNVSFLENLSRPTDAAPLTRVLPRSLKAKLIDYVGVMKTMRAAEKIKKTLGAEIKSAMDNQAGIATCGSLVVTCKRVDAVPAQITLRDGRELALAGATFVLADGKTRVKWDEIASVFGGRAGYLDLSVTDTTSVN